MLCIILVFFLASMFLVVYNLNSREHNLAKQLPFNQPVSLSLKIPLQVINSGINPISYAFFKRDIKHKCGNDFYYNITLQVINPGINPKVLRFLQKRYKARTRKASLQKTSLFNSRVVPTQEKH